MQPSTPREPALLAYFSSPRASDRHAPPAVIHLSRLVRMPVWQLYELSNHQSRHYRLARLPKRSGGFRELHIPDDALKQVQRAILHTILPCFTPADAATAYRPGGSLRGNALPHAGKPLVCKLDIRDFFDSITYALVRREVFSDAYFPPPAAAMLTALCTLDDFLPQGAPTSPAIANLVLRPFDEAIAAHCRARGIAYTRYCDDMAFSGDFDPRELRALVRQELRPLGMALHPDKTRCLPQGTCQKVTGVCVNQRPRMPASDRRALRQTLYYCRRFGVESHLAYTGSTAGCEIFLRSLLGKVSFALHLDPTDAEMQDYRDWLLGQLQEQ